MHNRTMRRAESINDPHSNGQNAQFHLSSQRAHSAVKTHAAMVKRISTNQTSTQPHTWHTMQANPKHTQTPELQSPVVFSGEPYGGSAVRFSRNPQKLYRSIHLPTQIPNMALDHPNSSCILQIEENKILDLNLQFTYHAQYSTKFNSNHMYMTYASRSTFL